MPLKPTLKRKDSLLKGPFVKTSLVKEPCHFSFFFGSLFPSISQDIWKIRYSVG